MNVDGVSSPVTVPEGTYTGTTLAAALELRINQMESTTGKTVNGVNVAYDLANNRLLLQLVQQVQKVKCLYLVQQD